MSSGCSHTREVAVPLGLGRLKRHSKRLRLDNEQQVAFLHRRAIFEGDLPQKTGHARPQIDRRGGARRARELDVVAHRLTHRLGDRHFRRRRRDVFIALAAPGDRREKKRNKPEVRRES